MKQALLVILFSFSVNIMYCQPAQQYQDYRGNSVPIDKAQFYVTIDRYGDIFYRNVFYLRDDQLQMEGFYLDAKCRIPHGALYYYYPNGYMEKACIYKKGQLNGLFQSYYDNGVMSDSAFYSKGAILGVAYSWHRNGMFKDSVLLNKDGSGVRVSWHSNGQPASAGYYAPSTKKRGTWQYFHSNGKTAAREKYENGQLESARFFDESGQELAVPVKDKTISFPGDTTEWNRYVAKGAAIPSGWDDIKPGEVTVLVDATFTLEGKLLHAFVATPFHPAFDKVALQLVTASPDWLPAIEHNRKVESQVRLPITFTRNTQ